MTTIGWLLALFFAIAWIHSRIVIRSQDDLLREYKQFADASHDRFMELHKEIEPLTAENVTLRAALESRLQAQNYPHGFRVALPYLREWPN